MNHVLLMMGGSGARFGGAVPKQFVEVQGRPVFTYAMSAYERFAEVDDIVVVCHAAWVDYAERWARKAGIAKHAGTVAGGATRSESVRCGLRKLAEIARDDDIVLIHDATHPYLDAAAAADAICAARKFGASTLACRQFDTMYLTDPAGFAREVIPRELVVSGASPELFAFGPLLRACEEAGGGDLGKFTSVGAIALANGVFPKVVPTGFLNLKITHRDDMRLFERLLTGYYL